MKLKKGKLLLICKESLLIKINISWHQDITLLIVLYRYPFSLAMIIVKICSEVQARDNRLQELKEMLLVHGYTTVIIDAAITKARKSPGWRLLNEWPGTQTTRDLILWSLMTKGSPQLHLYSSGELEVYGVTRPILKISISLPFPYSI